MMKAFYDVAGAENIEKLTVNFSLGKGYYIEPHGEVKLTEGFNPAGESQDEGICGSENPDYEEKHEYGRCY